MGDKSPKQKSRQGAQKQTAKDAKAAKGNAAAKQPDPVVKGGKK
jgi:hypothetical protein